MNKKVVDEQGYIDALNQELRKQPEYQEGMEVVGVPEGTSARDLNGYNWKGDGYLMSMLLSRIKPIVDKSYQLRVTR